MADITARATIKGAHQVSDRPFGLHVWEVSWLDTGTSSGDVILLPDKFDKNSYCLGAYGQVVVISTGSVSNSVALQMGATPISTGTFANVVTPWTALDTTTISTNIQASSTAALLSAFQTDAGVVAGTSWGQFRILITKGGTAGSATPKVLIGALLGRVEY